MYCYCKGQRGCGDLKVVYILNFCQIGGEGEGHQIFLFPKFKKVHIFVGEGEAGGGDQENYGLFPLFGTFFNSDDSI